MLALVGRVYTTLSFAAPPVVVVFFLVLFSRFRENGPQSQGLGALAVIALAACGVAFGNAVIAAVVAGFMRAVRPRPIHVALVAAAASALLGLLLLVPIE